MQILSVVIIAAAIIYFIGREVIGAFRHLNDDELIDFWNGHLRKSDPKAFRRASEHLGSCSSCRDRLDETRKHYAGPGVDAPLIERKY